MSFFCNCQVTAVCYDVAMKPDAAPSIHSFIIRFVVEEAPASGEEQPAYHGAIRHVQSAEEMNFISWTEAIEFMRHFVPLEEAGTDRGQNSPDSEAQPSSL